MINCLNRTFFLTDISDLSTQERIAGSLRLVDGFTVHEGRVEMYLNGRWGTVCDSSWDLLDAIVVCRQLGYSTAVAELRFGEGVGFIWLTNVQCKGYEANLTQCTSHRDAVNHCAYGHSRDAGVNCSSKLIVIIKTCY